MRTAISANGMIESNNTLELNKISDLHKTLTELNRDVRSRQGMNGLSRIHFQDGTDSYWMLLQENNLGFNVSGTLNGAISYQLNKTIFGRNAEIGEVVLKIAAATPGTTVEQFFV